MIGKLHLKICGMKDSANRQELESLPVDLFGFIFYPPSPRYAGDIPMADLQELTATRKNRVGVFVNAGLKEIMHLSEMLSLTHIQLHGNEPPEFCQALKAQGMQIIKAFRINPSFGFNETAAYKGIADFLLFDTKAEKPGGTGKKFQWEILDRYNTGIPFFLSGGIGPGDAKLIRELNHPLLFGLDLNSGFEESPGKKNPDKLREFFGELEET